jgi:type VI secretion system secreted protein Hcp
MPSNIYLKFDDSLLKGESTTEHSKDEIEVLSYSHSVSMPLSSSSASNVSRVKGRTHHQDFTITKWVDSASPTLNQYCSEGVGIEKVTLTIYVPAAGKSNTTAQKGAAAKLFVYTLEDVIISSVSVSGGGEDTPIETISLNYACINWSSERTGSKTSGWDLAKDKAK